MVFLQKIFQLVFSHLKTTGTEKWMNPDREVFPVFRNSIFNDVFLAPTGLRLIDVGISALRSQVGERLFERFLQQELNELEEFKAFFLSR